MSNIYFPYAADAEEQHRHSVRHKYSAIAHPRYGDPFELEITGGSLTFDSSWSPYIQGDITVAMINDPEKLSALDPRNGCRVKIFMGYTYDGFRDDSHLAADLHIRGRHVSMPGNDIRLTLAGDEALAQDWKRLSWQNQPSTVGINELVYSIADVAQRPNDPIVYSEFDSSHGTPELAGLIMEVGQDGLSTLIDAADRVGAWISCDSDRTWRVLKRPEYSGETALKLFTGPDSTLLDVSTTLTRGESQGTGFHNSVCITYRWSDENNVEYVVYGNAQIKTGPFSVNAVGDNTYFEERNFPATQTQANNVAAAVLKSVSGRGHQMEMTAHSAFWLRPGMTVTVQLPLEEQQRLIVRSVSFDISNKSMRLTLTQPIDVTIETEGP